MRSLLLSLSLLLTLNSLAFAEESFLDVASPDEVAAELGLAPMIQPKTSSVVPSPLMMPMTLQTHNRMANLDLTQYFPVVIIVNKSENAATGQQMTVYHRGALKWQFDVSTGRERWEDAKSGRRYFSVTSVGWFAPTKMVEKYYSKTWLAQMNNAIFFNGGLALHATTPDHFKALGKRDSGGCVRLHPKNAKLIWDLVTSEGKGQVPAYTWDGKIERDMWGKIVYREHWNTLIIIEDEVGN